jgi:hypothetical protein
MMEIPYGNKGHTYMDIEHMPWYTYMAYSLYMRSNCF